MHTRQKERTAGIHGTQCVLRHATQCEKTCPNHSHTLTQVDANGTYTGEYTPFALAGYLRAKAESDQAINVLASEAGLMRDLMSFGKSSQFKAARE